MIQDRQDHKSKPRKKIHYTHGKIYFSKETERAFYFILTLMMLLMGFLARIGLF